MNIDNWSYGYEVEWGDINRKLKVPSHLGSWEIAETDILNLKEPNKYIACDPLGIKPCFGGEINTTPNINYNDQVNKILELYKFFKENGIRRKILFKSIHIWRSSIKLFKSKL